MQQQDSPDKEFYRRQNIQTPTEIKALIDGVDNGNDKNPMNNGKVHEPPPMITKYDATKADPVYGEMTQIGMLNNLIKSPR